MPKPTIVRISGPAAIEVIDAHFGHNLYVGPLVNNPDVEHGALINLLGIDHDGAIPDQGWRFVDPEVAPDATRNGLHILWITHDHSGPFCNGDLQIGFNSVRPGHHYANPVHTNDKSLGHARGEWTTVYADDTLQVLFKAPPNGNAGQR